MANDKKSPAAAKPVAKDEGKKIEETKGASPDVVVTEASPKEVVKAPEVKKVVKEDAKVEEKATVEVKASSPKTRPCIGLKKHSCKIGHTNVSIEKDKTYNLTWGVAAVLQRAGVIIIK